MRSLFVGRWDPWPARSGAQLRSAMIVEALAELGPVDLVVLRAGDDGDPGAAPYVPDGVDVDRAVALARAERPVRRRRDRARWMLGGRLPPGVAGIDPAPTRAELNGWVRRPYDLAWFERVETHALLGPVVDAPAVVDVDELRDVSTLRRLADSWPEPPPVDRPSRLRDRFDRVAQRREAGSWRRLQRASAQSAAAAVVCSPIDAQRLRGPNVAVVPNCIVLPDDVVPTGAVGDVSATPEGEGDGAPPVLFFGSLRYWPNADAAQLLVRDVFPQVRSRLPTARLRLVGDARPEFRRLDGRPGLEVPGAVEQIGPELDAAGVVAVPLRYGSGTRLKILEALAYEKPIVATSIAVEGLDVVDGEHVLVADSAREFAEAIVRVLTEPHLATRLGAAGRRLVEQRYAWPIGVADVQRLAREVAVHS